MPIKAEGAAFPLTLLDMAKNERELRKLFGPNSAVEETTENAYHHAGTEYRLDDHALIEAAANAKHGPLVNWVREINHKLLARWINKVSGIDHLDEATEIAQYHDFQAVLCQLDTGSARRTRGVEGSLGVPKNAPNPLPNTPGTASS